MNWYQLAQERKDELFTELQQLIQIESILDKEQVTEQFPFGPKPAEALEFLLDKGKKQGMNIKNVDHVAGHIEMGEGEDLLGILCHVDVVPAGEGWTYPAFGGEIANGKLYGRGAIDDKGPTMAAWMAMKLVQDAGIELTKRVRLIIGTDEESGFRCVRRYFETEEMPTIGFAPDADFPIIHAEKGIASLVLSQKGSTEEEIIHLFTSGKRTNMVPDQATAILNLSKHSIETTFVEFLESRKLTGHAEELNGKTTLIVNGKSAHAMEPENGINAGIKLAEFLLTLPLKGQSKSFVDFTLHAFGSDSRGHQFKGAFSDTVSGDTTYNAGIIHFSAGEGLNIQVSMRYSVSCPIEQQLDDMRHYFESQGIQFEVTSNSKPHYVEESDELIDTLKRVYERQTGEKAELLAIGGGTYARVLKKGVAFGMLFPGEEDVAHQADEFVDIENLIKATAIYADAIAELAGKKE